MALEVDQWELINGSRATEPRGQGFRSLWGRDKDRVHWHELYSSLSLKSRSRSRSTGSSVLDSRNISFVHELGMEIKQSYWWERGRDQTRD